MKRISKFIIPALLAFAALTACKETGAPANTESSTTAAITAPATALSGKIVYVNTDSLISKYNLYIDRFDELEKKSKQIETNLASKTASLEKDIISFQEKVQKSLVTRLQAQALEEDLQKKQQELLEYRDKVVGELAEEESVLFNQIQHNLMEYLRELNADGRYDMIISSTSSAPVLMANPALDITNEVLEGLNKKYTPAKKK